MNRARTCSSSECSTSQSRSLLIVFALLSRYLDSEQRIVASKVIKRFISHSNRSAFIVEHDFIMATYLADSVIVYDGVPGREVCSCLLLTSHCHKLVVRHLSILWFLNVGHSNHTTTPVIRHEQVLEESGYYVPT